MRAPESRPMYTLRDCSCSYEVCPAADLRRPPTMPYGLDPQWVLDLARTLGRDEANLRVITELVESATGRAASGAVVYERFAELIVRGRLVLRERVSPQAYPLPDPYAEPPMPLAELVDEEAADEAPRSWISLELVHAAGLSSERLELQVTTPSGRALHGRLDAEGRWRSEDVEGGTCTIELLDHPVLQRRKRALRARTLPQRGDLVWPVGSERRLELRAAEHHRIVIVQPPEPYCPSA